ncbi:MAG TPA: response regulator [Planctomycetota bacterium]|nr:response regulator [Planctomycetota bacterium]
MSLSPSESGAEKQVSTSAPTPLVSGRFRILHVEDNPTDVELIGHALRRGGLDVEIMNVTSLGECERLLEREKFDAIICDYNLPSGDGLEVLAAVRKRDSEIPFLLVSGSLGEEKAIEALKMGATDYLLKDRLHRIHVALLRSVTDARERARARALETQLIQAQKMEAIGRLAGGVAHDFNNMLTVINGYSELLLAQMPPEDPKRRDLEEIHNAGKRAAGLTRQLLAFSRRQILQPTILNLNELIEGLERMLSRLIGEDVKLQLRLSHDLRLVKGDAGQIEQVVANLVVNARDAMPKGGKITVETLNVDLDQAFAAAHPDVRPGPHVLLLVSDTGMGMTAEVKSHLFEPFFTTKERGKGTGLGLSTALGIIQQCGGSIQVSSEPGWGTTFRIYLPQTDQGAEPKSPTTATAPSRPGRETLLVAEDMETVRRLTRAVLESEGYTVLLAEDGVQACAVADGHQGPIHLLLTDIVMPNLNGPELAERLRRSRPSIGILYMSGYTDRGLDEIKQGLPGSGYLQKPFTVAELKRKVRESLDALAKIP